MFHRYLKRNFRAVIAEGKSWQIEKPKILMLYRASPHPFSGKSPAMLLFTREIRIKVPHLAHDANVALDREHRAGCESYLSPLENNHDAKQRTTRHDCVGDVAFCATIKPNKLDSTFSPAKHVVIKSQGRDIFSVVNVSNGTTLVRNAKYLKQAPISEVVTDSSDSTDVVDPQAKAMESVGSQRKNSDACRESVRSDDQGTQNNSGVTDRSGSVVKSPKRLGQLCLFGNYSDCVFNLVLLNI